MVGSAPTIRVVLVLGAAALLGARTFPESHFHHLHLNATDPKAALDSHPSKLDCEKARFAGLADAVAMAEWHMKYFGARLVRAGAKLSREPITLRGTNIGPIASLMIDNVNLIVFPMDDAKMAYKKEWEGRADFAPARKE